MKTKESKIHFKSLLKNSINTIFENKIIFSPFCVIIFIQLFCLDVLYFFPRWPLKVLFGPIVSKLWAESYLHYPMNLVLLPKLFQYSQIPVYIFLGSFFIGVAVNMIIMINENKSCKLGQAIKETLPYYVMIVFFAMISFFIVWGFYKLYGLAYARALLIRSQGGKFYLLKRIVIDGAPYFNLLINVFVTTLFAYVVPIILVDKRKVLYTFWHNFKMLWGSFWFTFSVVLIPSLFLVPILLLRTSVSDKFFPELSVYILASSVLVMAFIDATIYTAVTTFYLLKREDR